MVAVGVCGLLTGLGVIVAAAPAAADPLRNHAGSRFIGYALNLNAQSSDAMYRTVAAREFNSVTAENAMKWEATEPNPNQFSFGGADQVVAAAQANNQQIHGHTLVWHSQTPGWVQSLNATDMRAAMQRHINTVVGRYANSVRSWDVVNEAFNEDGSRRASFWQNTLGNNYIADAFRMADAADPDAELCINDFNTDGMNAKSNGLFSLVQSLVQQGVPINCVGFQGHLATQFSFPSQVQQNFQRFANLGLNVKITELDVRMPNPRDSAKDTAQATYFRNMVNACLGVGARCNQITFWGFTDKFSWVPDTFPSECCALLYDANYNPKPAYTAVHDALGGGQTDPDTTPPTTPGTPTVSGVTSNSATLSWAASTDTGGSGLAGYNVHREQGATDPVLASPTTNSTMLTGLTPSTQYQVYIRARDGAGNLSTASATVTFTTLAGPVTGTCRVTYSASNWGGGGGFTAGVTIVNTGTAAINGWTLAFSYTAGQRVTMPGWGATWAQPAGSGNVTATPLSWNANLAPNSPTNIGFNGTFTGSNPAPASFTLNGTACATG
jgi:endo-1,4-beta-xylanase